MRSLAVTFPPSFRIVDHDHSWPQLVYATRGVLTVATETGSWVVPSLRAVWVPRGVTHTIETTGTVSMRTLYLHPELAEGLATGCLVLNVSPLLREIILEVVRRGFLRKSRGEEARLSAVLVDQLVGIREIPLVLRVPRDSRAKRVADQVCARPGEIASLEDLAVGSGASSRTLERLFQKEVGMTFGRWRQQVRLLRALRLLAEGVPVSSVSHEVGYESPSAFIAMFKRALGKTPRRYYEESRSLG